MTEIRKIAPAAGTRPDRTATQPNKPTTAPDPSKGPAAAGAVRPDARMSADQAAPRWQPVTSIPGFNAAAGDVERMNGCGMVTGIVNGVLCIQSADLGRARELIAARRR